MARSYFESDPIHEWCPCSFVSLLSLVTTVRGSTCSFCVLTRWENHARGARSRGGREVDELLRNGANPSVGHAQDDGLTPLHFAARSVATLSVAQIGMHPRAASPSPLLWASYSISSYRLRSLIRVHEDARVVSIYGERCK